MNRSEADAFLKTHHQAVLSTIRRDGRPQMSNVAVGYQEGRLVVSTREMSAKVRNIERDGRVSVLVLGDNFWQYLVVDGSATFTRLPQAHQPLRDYYQITAGKPHPDWDEYDRAMEAEKRVLVSISVDHIYPLDQ